jgi:small subunit ribosomal protein S2
MAKYKVPDSKELLEAGVHVGHRVKRWNPRMEQYIYAVKKDVHIINLEKTEELLRKASDFLYQITKEGKQVVFVGTKRQASELVELAAKRCGALYATERWLGGTLTNYSIIKKRIDSLVTLMKRRESGDLNKYTKKERLMFDREIEKLQNSVGGLINLQSHPGAVFVIDAARERTAVREANSKGIPVVALIDTNSDPSNIMYPVPGNDDAIKSIVLILNTLSDAVEAGYKDFKEPKEEAKKEEEVAEEPKVEEKTPAKDERKVEKKEEKKKEVVKPEEAKKSAPSVQTPKKRGRPKSEGKKVTSSKEKK